MHFYNLMHTNFLISVRALLREDLYGDIMPTKHTIHTDHTNSYEISTIAQGILKRLACFFYFMYFTI